MERLIKTGKVKPKHSSEIKTSKFGIGFEKLDRDVFNPEKAYDKLAAIGVKWVRIQSGWQRTEQQKGVYDFKWLDKVVDNLIARGCKPWLCLCYGNGLYDEAAAKVFGAVGCPPIHTAEQIKAWENYVKATVEHYSTRIDTYEIWNEPDGKWCWKHGPSGTELGEFSARTARYIKAVKPDATVVGGVVCMRELSFINDALKAGMGKEIDAISFHEYTPVEETVFERVSSLRALGRMYNPNMEIIQGESGSQSRSGGNGALWSGSWTQLKQAKQLTRHAMADIIAGCKFTSYFSCMDMIEALNGTVGNTASYLDYGYFGVLGADFDENGHSTGEYTPKISYTALATLCSLFSDETEKCDLPIMFRPEQSPRIFDEDLKECDTINAGFKKPNGSKAFVYWHPSSIMTTDYEGTVTLQIAGITDEVKFVDTVTGEIYKIPDDMIERSSDDCYCIRHLPVKDYPMVITFGDFE